MVKLAETIFGPAAASDRAATNSSSSSERVNDSLINNIVCALGKAKVKAK